MRQIQNLQSEKEQLSACFEEKSHDLKESENQNSETAGVHQNNKRGSRNN